MGLAVLSAWHAENDFASGRLIQLNLSHGEHSPHAIVKKNVRILNAFRYALTRSDLSELKLSLGQIVKT